MPSNEWLLAEQAAERVGRSERTIRDWGNTGRVRRMRPGRLWWYFIPDLLITDKETVTRTRVSQD